MSLPGGSDSKESTCSVGDLGLIPGLGKSPGGEHGNPLQYFPLENPHGQRSLAGYSLWGCKELDMTIYIRYTTVLWVLWPLDAKSLLIGKDTDAGKDWRQEKGTTVDRMVGWHHWLNGREFEWTPGVADGQGGLAFYNSWDWRVEHDWATELNWTEYSKVYMYHIFFIHSSTDGHLGCFHVLPIVNSAAMKIRVHVSF